jgi:hypothetical protein
MLLKLTMQTLLIPFEDDKRKMPFEVGNNNDTLESG